jgi:hypothetical protein
VEEAVQPPQVPPKRHLLICVGRGGVGCGRREAWELGGWGVGDGGRGGRGVGDGGRGGKGGCVCIEVNGNMESIEW